MSKKFENILKESKAMGEINDCAVIAVAVATNNSYKKVHSMLAKLGREKGQPTPDSTSDYAMAKLGYAVANITHTIKAKTVKSACKELQNGTYLVTIKGHIFAVVNGSIKDWAWAIGNIAKFKIDSVQQVVKIEVNGGY
jgi:hypothetical protein